MGFMGGGSAICLSTDTVAIAPDFRAYWQGCVKFAAGEATLNSTYTHRSKSRKSSKRVVTLGLLLLLLLLRGAYAIMKFSVSRVNDIDLQGQFPNNMGI